MARRRVPDAPDEPAGRVPPRLRRFRRADWRDAADQLDAHRAFRSERMAWARAHGYLVDAPYGEAPGRDWWAFLAACREEGRPG